MRIRSFAALTLCLAVLTTPAAAQTTEPPVKLDAPAMEHYIAAIRAMNARKAEFAAVGTEEKAKTLMGEVCAGAGFPDADQCGSTIAYVGTLFSGFDVKQRAFIDPVDAARNRIAMAENDKRLSPQAKAAQVAQNRAFLDQFTLKVPTADIALMNTYRDQLLSIGR